jgi:hypothetical protein
MEDATSCSSAVLDDVSAALRGPYRDAVSAHLEYEVFEGFRNKKALQEFEAALSHLADALMQNDKSQVAHLVCHCQRIAIETTEWVAEEFLKTIRSRFDPYYKYPRLSKMLLLVKPTFLDPSYVELRNMQDLITEGRKLKGNAGTYKDCLAKFKEAVILGKVIDKKTPMCAFSERLFAVILTFVGLLLGWVLGLITTR